MCELLIYAKTHWLEGLTPEDREKRGLVEKYNRRLVKGNPIVVKRDGWKWGKRECPPDFVVVKVPDMSEKDAQKYLEPAYDLEAIPNPETGEYPIKYRKKYKLDNADVDAALITKEPIVTTKAIAETKLTDRTKAVVPIG